MKFVVAFLFWYGSAEVFRQNLPQGRSRNQPKRKHKYYPIFFIQLIFIKDFMEKGIGTSLCGAEFKSIVLE